MYCGLGYGRRPNRGALLMLAFKKKSVYVCGDVDNWNILFWVVYLSLIKYVDKDNKWSTFFVFFSDRMNEWDFIVIHETKDFKESRTKNIKKSPNSFWC